jgi:hypothetical protein
MMTLTTCAAGRNRDAEEAESSDAARHGKFQRPVKHLLLAVPHDRVNAWKVRSCQPVQRPKMRRPGDFAKS